MTRRTQRSLIVAGAVLGIAAAVAAGLYYWAAARLERVVTDLQAEAPKGVEVGIGGQAIRVLERTVRLKNIQIVDKRGGTTRSVRIDTARLAGRGWQLPTSRTIPRLTADGIRFAGAGLRQASLERLALRRVDLAAWRRVLQADKPGQAVGATLFRRLTARKLTGRGEAGTFRVAKLSARDPEQVGGELRALTWRLDGLHVEPSLADASPLVGAGMPGNELRADVRVRPVLLRAPDGVALRKLRIAVPDAGTVTGSVALTGVKVAQLVGSQPTEFGGAAQQARLKALKLTYADAGLAKRLLARLAQERGLTRSGYIDRLEQRLRSAFGDAELVDDLVQFLRARGKISVRLAPDQPIGLMAATLAFFVDPQQMLARLNVQVETGAQ